mmetsp:Transcript_2157/g.1932  ORF Transcript_2157/g.1932 Transcript_2157/m.1932 type:complete len:207 (+) Transcript_2157:1095-1715(+)
MSESSKSSKSDGLASSRNRRQSMVNYIDDYNDKEHINDEWIGDEEIIVIPNTSITQSKSNNNILISNGKDIISPTNQNLSYDDPVNRKIISKGAIISDDFNDIQTNRVRTTWDKSTATKTDTLLQIQEKLINKNLNNIVSDSQEYSDNYEDDINDEESIEDDESVSNTSIDNDLKYKTNASNEKLKWKNISTGKHENYDFSKHKKF